MSLKKNCALILLITVWFLLKSQVWKLVWKMTFFGLQKGQDLENKEHTPIKNFQEYHPPTLRGEAPSSSRVI